MPEKIVLFGPVASGKSTYLRRARAEFPACLTIEMDDVTLDKPEQEIFARGVLSQSYRQPLFMTAGKLDVCFVRPFGCKVVRIAFADEAAYMGHVQRLRSERIGREYTEAQLLDWYRCIKGIPPEQFAAEVVTGQMSEQQGWDTIRALV